MEESTLIAKSKTILSACYALLEAKRTEKSYEALLHAFSHSHNNLEVLKQIFNINNDSEKIFQHYVKELTEMTLGVGSVIDDIEERKHDLVDHIKNTIDDWRNDINMRIKDSDSSYTYSSKNEEMLWYKETWNIKLLGRHSRTIQRLLGNDDSYNIDKWIETWATWKYDIFFCGGNDAKFIQEFATKVKEVNSEIQPNIKFAYIGNNKKAKSLVKSISGYALRSNNAEYLWFWTQLCSAFLSRIYYLNKGGRIEDEDKNFLGL
ncbi:PREDICTED: uncharacterized protein LOC109185700 [Ipomoea nil]|uniref:uncharacterized protein LOC109185700 n=1 Tax=Ipomoea nil TaxID=35883 RepID=UPI000901EA91|nr:PREDICTED: uncharacterized protein LOC109185700 [Ipomoea nil]XP_019191198.1 PREDICTED: uncharacterized protein LOC109185700 [Ipomoea nil]